MKDSFFNNPPIAQVLDDNSLEKLRRDTIVPDPLGIHRYDWTLFTHPEARGLASLHPCRPEQQIFPLEQCRQM